MPSIADPSLKSAPVHPRGGTLWIRACAAILLGAGATAQTVPQNARTVLDQAVTSFAAGRIDQSVAEFDQLARLVPNEAPYLWQRGIAQFYAGRFRECRAQFESHRTVNPDDVENAVWHFLCVARGESVAAARAALLPVGPDGRVPMREIYQMFRGALGPDQVIAAAGRNLGGEFYAHLYVGLYLEAVGDRAAALDHLRAAADRRYASAGGYMHMVAGVHLKLRERAG